MLIPVGVEGERFCPNTLSQRLKTGMETRISLQEARSRFDELLQRVEAGEQIIITRAGRDLAQLCGIETAEDIDQLPSLEKWRSSIDAGGPSLSDTVLKQRKEERY